jgi:3-hydroxybutyryl-CoA dehydrogenase
VQRCSVVGCGIMGAGIAEVAARAGCDVVVLEATDELAAAGAQRVDRSLARAVASKRLSEFDAEAARHRLSYVTDYEALADREIVMEAVAESEPVKLEVFSRIDAVVRDRGAVLASNTSSIPITRLAAATSRPEAVLGMHFFNPVPVLPLVELVASLSSSTETVARARSFCTDVLEKTVIDAKDRAGFVVNALLIPYLLSAIRMLEAGFATAEDIDQGMVKGCAHPMGPLALADLIGLDTTRAIAESLFQEFKESHFAPPPLLSRLVEAGRLGRKSGQGFFSYER